MAWLKFYDSPDVVRLINLDGFDSIGLHIY